MSDRIQCPVCKVDMVDIKCHETEVDRCPKCKGIWFDILEHEDLKRVKGSAQEIDGAARSVETDSEGKVIDCPRCHTRMSPTHDAEQSHIVYEKCSTCSGVYFDAGEFTDLQEVTIAEKLKNWVG